MNIQERPEYKAHSHSIHNVNELMESEKIGCFYCLRIFSHTKITDFCDGGDTALCPCCGIDSLIGDRSGYPITKVFLQGMNQIWF